MHGNRERVMAKPFDELKFVVCFEKGVSWGGKVGITSLVDAVFVVFNTRLLLYTLMCEYFYLRILCLLNPESSIYRATHL